MISYEITRIEIKPKRIRKMSSDLMAVTELEFESVRFPTWEENPTQDEEWCFVQMRNRETRKIRFHDYYEVFAIEGLYEHLFYEKLQCDSPITVADLLAKELEKQKTEMADLAVLDVGAGNGMVGEALKKADVETVVGLDIVEEAREATYRDRPGVYERYFIEDLTDFETGDAEKYAKYGLNCLTIVAALGFGDIPPLAFANAFNLITSEGWIVFNIKEEFLQSEEDSTGFSRLVTHMFDEKIMRKCSQKRYRHRLSINGTPLYYVAFVAKKIRNLPLSCLDEIE